MRDRRILLASLAANILLAVVLALVATREPRPSANLALLLVRTQQVVVASRTPKTQVVATNAPFSWRQLESADYRAYIANLRMIGCPEATLRDIIVSDINQLYARRRAAEVPTEHDEWWRSEPDAARMARAASKLEALDAERRALLAQLLGTHWDKDLPPEMAHALTIGLASARRADGSPLVRGRDTGPILTGSLAALPVETRTALRDLWGKFSADQEAARQARRATGLGGEDPAEMAKLRKEFREQLEKTLPSEQAEEFLLRNSRVGSQLRDQMQGFTTTPEEFRTIYRALDAADKSLNYGEYERDPVRRAEAERQKELTLKQALGEERYEQFRLNQDPNYRSARSLAGELGAQPQTIQPLYEVGTAFKAELNRIKLNPELTPAQRAAEIEAAQQAQREAMKNLLDPDAYERFIERGLRGR